MLATIQSIVQSPQLVFAHPKYRHHCQEHSDQPVKSVKDIIASHRLEFHRVTGRPGRGEGNETVGWELGAIQSIQDHLEEYRCDEAELTSHAVFFDCVGFLTVIYSSRTAQLVNWATVAVTVLYLLALHRSPVYTWKRTLQSLLVLLVSMLASVASSMTVAAVLVALDRTMRWYARPVLSAGSVLHPHGADDDHAAEAGDAAALR